MQTFFGLGGGGTHNELKTIKNAPFLKSKSHLFYTTFWITCEGHFLPNMWENNILKQHSITCIRGFVGKRRH